MNVSKTVKRQATLFIPVKPETNHKFTRGDGGGDAGFGRKGIYSQYNKIDKFDNHSGRNFTKRKSQKNRPGPFLYNTYHKFSFGNVLVSSSDIQSKKINKGAQTVKLSIH
mmetsp:Transcript_35469/g.82306  ORF Transcript_35469/g.82306 Transcript_35469/m.82306 type:complete len:110 (-) Transcript_35469:2658-2987(-)